MRIDYTIYVKQQPLPLIGDELWPDGCVGITTQGDPSMTYSEVEQVVKTFQAILAEMRR